MDALNGTVEGQEVERDKLLEAIRHGHLELVNAAFAQHSVRLREDDVRLTMAYAPAKVMAAVFQHFHMANPSARPITRRWLGECGRPRAVLEAALSFDLLELVDGMIITAVQAGCSAQTIGEMIDRGYPTVPNGLRAPSLPSSPLFIALQERRADLSLFDMLLNRGGLAQHLHLREKGGGTLLHRAVLANSMPHVQMLLGYGADVYAVNDDAYSGLACALKHGLVDCIRVLTAAATPDLWTGCLQHADIRESLRAHDALSSALLEGIKRGAWQRRYAAIQCRAAHVA